MPSSKNLLDPAPSTPSKTAVAKEVRPKPRTPTKPNRFAYDVLNEIISEYNQKIAELSQITAELPKRLCSGTEETPKAKECDEREGAPRIATSDSSWRPVNSAVAPLAQHGQDFIHPEDEVDESPRALLGTSGNRTENYYEQKYPHSIIDASENDVVTPQYFSGDGASTDDEKHSIVDASGTFNRVVSPSAMSSAISGTFSRAPPSVLFRLQARLGVQDWDAALSGLDIHTAITCLGLERYSPKDIERLVTCMYKHSPTAQMYPACDPDSVPSPTNPPAPKAPRLKRSGPFASAMNLGSALFSEISLGSSLFSEDVTRFKIPVMEFAEYLISTSSGKKLGKEFEDMLVVLKEILVAGDTNRLIAELTSVRIDDLTAPPPVLDWDVVFEPIIGIMILLNCVVIGLQTDPGWENWSGWAWIECTFALTLVFELLTRIRFTGLRMFCIGRSSRWNIFDTLIAVSAVVGTVMEFLLSDRTWASYLTSFTIVRTIRLTRLTRLFRVFRLDFLRELTIMVKGFFAGFRTLMWADVLLLCTIFILAVFATITIGKSDRVPVIAQDRLFTTVPRSMLTLFRCSVGDCTTSKGQPIVKLLGDVHGVQFAACYVASMTLVTLGLFNLITALYVEIAMAAAKRTEEKDRNRAHRESLRVAHITKKLLKKFCAAQRHVADPRRMEVRQVAQTLAETFEHQDIDESQTISSELFLLIIQDPEVQRLMNDLDIPPDRANLFDVLDADGTGDLHVTELVQGLLKVRGEARKSDVIASLLAVRAVQEMLRLMESKMTESQSKIMEHLGITWTPDALHKTSIWSVPAIRKSIESRTSTGSRKSRRARYSTQPHYFSE